MRWLSIILLLPRSFCWCDGQATRSARKFCLEYFSKMYCTRRESGKERVGRRHRGAGNFGRVRNPCSKAQCNRSNNAEKQWKFAVHDRRLRSRTTWRRSGSENIHPGSGTARTMRGARSSSRIIRRISTIKRFCWWHSHHVEPRVKLQYWSKVPRPWVYTSHLYHPVHFQRLFWKEPCELDMKTLRKQMKNSMSTAGWPVAKLDPTIVSRQMENSMSSMERPVAHKKLKHIFVKLVEFTVFLRMHNSCHISCAKKKWMNERIRDAPQPVHNNALNTQTDIHAAGGGLQRLWKSLQQR